MICAACGESTGASPCGACGEDPLLDGRYRLEAALGRGAGAVTWRATELASGRTVAIKESPLPAGGDGKAAELAEREARVLQQLDHPQIPRFVASIVSGRGKARSLSLVQEYVDGQDLRARLQSHRYAEAEVLDTLEALCPVLEYLHGLSPPVVHRDLKPANVIRRQDGSHALVDFGSVRDALRELGGSTVAGTFGYMAPEQFAGDAGPRSDLYGLGALAVALLTRRDPAGLAGHDRRLRWREHATVTPGTAALIDQLLMLDPAARPPSARAVAERIAKLRGGAGRASAPARPHPGADTVEIVLPPRPTSPRPALVFGALAVVALGAAAVLTVLTGIAGVGAVLATHADAGRFPDAAPPRWSLALPRGLPPSAVDDLFAESLRKMRADEMRGALEGLYRILQVQPDHPHARKFAFAAGERLVADAMSPIVRARALDRSVAASPGIPLSGASPAPVPAPDTLGADLQRLRSEGRADEAVLLLLDALSTGGAASDAPPADRARWVRELRAAQREVAADGRDAWADAVRAEVAGDTRAATTAFTELAARSPSNPSPAAHLERLVGEASHPIGAIEPAEE